MKAEDEDKAKDVIRRAVLADNAGKASNKVAMTDAK